MAMRINATTISTSSSSWYQRLRTIQGKTPISNHSATNITKTTDPNITLGTRITSVQVASFISALTSSTMKNNFVLKNANYWSQAPSAPTAGTVISQSNIYNKVNNMLASLEALNANYTTQTNHSNEGTDSVNAYDTDYADNGDEGTCSEDGVCGHDGTNSDCSTCGASCDFCGEEYFCGTCARDGDDSNYLDNALDWCDYNGDGGCAQEGNLSVTS